MAKVFANTSIPRAPRESTWNARRCPKSPMVSHLKYRIAR
jgi:hypothetical protein